jgi:hypothetical protein
MDKVIVLLEQAVSDAVKVEVLAIMDREHLDRAVRGVRVALIELRALNRKLDDTDGANGAA